MNLTSLRNQVKDYLARDDISDSVFQVFLVAVEQDIFSNFQPLELDKSATITIENGEAELPSDAQYVRVVLDSQGATLEQIDNESFFQNKGGSYFTRRGNKLLFGDGVTSGEVTLLYGAYLQGLSSTRESNIISEKYPSVYLFGLLREASYYIKDTEYASIYNQRFMDALEAATVDDDKARYTGSRLSAHAKSAIVKGI